MRGKSRFRKTVMDRLAKLVAANDRILVTIECAEDGREVVKLSRRDSPVDAPALTVDAGDEIVL